MKILFVSSGNSSNFDVAPFIKSQRESLKVLGIDIQHFTLNGKGLTGYLKSAFKLRKYLKKNQVDIIHAHYTLSGWVAVLACSGKPKVLSLMGTDAYGEFIGVDKIKFTSRYLIFSTYLIQPFVQALISKSQNIEESVYSKKKSKIIPNGIDLEKIAYNKIGFKEELGLDPDKKHILFLGNKKNVRKNYKLLEEAMGRINSNDISVVTPYPVSHDQAVKYMNSVDVTVVPSLMEGSPNVVKEAMACNCPVVATDIGDIRWLFGDEPGHFLTTFDPLDMAEKIQTAIDFAQQKGTTRGRERIIELGLDSKTVAKRIIDVYKSVIK